MESIKILFVDKNDTCASYMAKEVVQQLLSRTDLTFVVESAGFNAENGKKATKKAVEVIRNLEIEVHDHSSRNLDVVTGQFDYLISLDKEIGEAIKTLYKGKDLFAKQVFWAFPDPIKNVHSHFAYEKYLKCCEKIQRKFPDWLAKELRKSGVDMGRIMAYTGLSRFYITGL